MQHSEKPFGLSAHFPPKLATSDSFVGKDMAIELAYELKITDMDSWEQGIDFEYRFWKNQFETGGGQWKESFALRIAPEAPLDPRMESLVAKSGSEPVRILDVGAGPV